MWGLFLAAALSGGLVALAATGPERTRRVLGKRLSGYTSLLREGRLSLSQAEDGAVIAKRLGRRADAEMFTKRARELRRSSKS